jgi:cytidylate kinase
MALGQAEVAIVVSGESGAGTTGLAGGRLCEDRVQIP